LAGGAILKSHFDGTELENCATAATLQRKERLNAQSEGVYHCFTGLESR